MARRPQTAQGSGSTDSARIEIAGAGAAIILRVRGALDDAGYQLLHDTLVAALDSCPSGTTVEVDLREVEEFTADGVRGLARCAQLGRQLGSPVQFRLGHHLRSTPVQPVRAAR